MSADLIKTGLAGLHYLQTYDRLLIRGIVTAAYIGWAAYASLFIFRPLDYATPPLKSSWTHILVNTTSAVTLLSFWILFAIQRSPWSFYVYIAFPCYFWQQFLLQVIPVSQTRTVWSMNHLRVLMSACMTIGVLHGMVVCHFRVLLNY